jgi:hypothetical protein
MQQNVFKKKFTIFRRFTTLYNPFIMNLGDKKKYRLSTSEELHHPINLR